MSPLSAVAAAALLLLLLGYLLRAADFSTERECNASAGRGARRGARTGLHRGVAAGGRASRRMDGVVARRVRGVEKRRRTQSLSGLARHSRQQQTGSAPLESRRLRCWKTQPKGRSLFPCFPPREQLAVAWRVLLNRLGGTGARCRQDVGRRQRLSLSLSLSPSLSLHPRSGGKLDHPAQRQY